MNTSFAASRRSPDRLMDELAEVLLTKAPFDFKDLFAIVFNNLKAKSASNGGEELMRLRAYEKLQSLVQSGLVQKNGKAYQGVPAALSAFIAATTDRNARMAQGVPACSPALQEVAAVQGPVSSSRKKARK